VPSCYVTKQNALNYVHSVKRILKRKELSAEDLDRIIQMAWEDRTPFEAIEFQFGLSEAETIELMRGHMAVTSFHMWRKRMKGRGTKHRKLSPIAKDEARFKSSQQRAITNNKISKR
jgi:uncharacterized protein (TIGR03643 family)